MLLSHSNMDQLDSRIPAEKGQSWAFQREIARLYVLFQPIMSFVPGSSNHMEELMAANGNASRLKLLLMPFLEKWQ